MRKAVMLLLCLAGFAGYGQTAEDWPVKRDGLVFCWRNGNELEHPPLAYDKNGNPIKSYMLTARGQARFGRHYQMELGAGSFLGTRLGPYLAFSFKTAQAFGLQLYLTAPADTSKTIRTVIAFESATDRCFALTQTDGQLTLHVKLGTKISSLPLGELSGRQASHLAISLADGSVTAWRNGKQVLQQAVKGDFSSWPRSAALVIGGDLKGGSDWAGEMEGIAIYNRGLTAAEAVREAAAYAAITAGRKAISQLKVKATLLQRSESKLKIEPYFRALALYEYRVDKVVSGSYDKKRIYVWHWTVSQGKFLPIAKRRLNQQYDLVLEPFDEHPQLETELQFDSLDWDLDQPVYYDRSPAKGR